MRILVGLAAALGACGGAPASAPDARTPVELEVPAEESRADGSPRLPPLTDQERAYRGELERHVNKLAGEIGERNTAEKWNLAGAADYVAVELESYGYVVGRQGYSVDDTMSQNLDADLIGSLVGDELVIVGAHYDSAVGTPGADDNATGVAALLVLAKAFRKERPGRTVRFVAFANEEAPHFMTDAMGSLVYARRTASRGERVTLMLSIESIGYFSTEAGTQGYPREIAGRFPTTGDFVAFVTRPDYSEHVERVLAAFRSRSSIGAEGAALPADLPGVGWSDHWAFWQVGIPAVMVTDTAPFRYPHHHRAEDTPDKLDFDRMARVVAGLHGVIEAVAGTLPNPPSPR